MSKHTHLTLDERIRIEQRLNEGASFRSIGTELAKDPTTIAKEVRHRLTFRQSGCYGKTYNNCLHRQGCPVQHLCGRPSCRRFCRFCQAHPCRTTCPGYEPENCRRLSHAPYVCNSCQEKSRCTLEKRLYKASFAQAEYERVRSEARSGLALTEEEALRLDALLSPLLAKGQSLHHICTNHADEIMCHERTLYSYVDQGIFTARNIDMPRVVRMGRRKPKKDAFKVDRKCRENRTYADYQAFMAEHPDLGVVEIDSVEGIKGGKVLLTVHFVAPMLMLAFLRDANTARSVTEHVERLYERLGCEEFRRLFPVLLGDNGSEFSNPAALEKDREGQERTRLFYCDPSAPWQKGAAENNHTLFRRVIPKGQTLDGLTQQEVDLIVAHVNSYARKNLGDKTPHEVFGLLYGEETLKALGVTRIAPDEVTLRPSLLK